MKKLNKLAKDWIESVGRSKRIPEQVVVQAGGKVFTFGSFRLGIHAPDADIDALCVAPRHVDRSDFFKGFVAVLEKTSGVVDIRVVEEAYVPVVKMKFDGIEVDLLFARLLVSQIKDDQVFPIAPTFRLP